MYVDLGEEKEDKVIKGSKRFIKKQNSVFKETEKRQSYIKE